VPSEKLDEGCEQQRARARHLLADMNRDGLAHSSLARQEALRRRLREPPHRENDPPPLPQPGADTSGLILIDSVTSPYCAALIRHYFPGGKFEYG